MPQDFYDAGDIIRWTAITISLSLNGDYTYEDAPYTLSGTITGSESVTLTRKAFDRTKALASQIDEDELAFVVCREVRSLHSGTDGPPLILLPSSIRKMSTGAFTRTTAYTSDGAGSGSEEFDSVSLDVSLIWVDKEGQNWGDPKTSFLQMSATANFPDGDGLFLSGADVVPEIEDEEAPFPTIEVPWAYGSSPSRTVTFPIPAPFGADLPDDVGSEELVVTVAFAG